MITDMKEQMKEQQARTIGSSDSRSWEHRSRVGGAETTQWLNSKLRSTPSKAPRCKCNQRANLEGGRRRSMSPSRIWGGPDRRLSYAKTAPTMKLSLLVSRWGFIMTKLGGRSRSFLTSKGSTCWSRGRSKRRSYNSVADTCSCQSLWLPSLWEDPRMWVPEEVLNPTFDHYSGASDLV